MAIQIKDPEAPATFKQTRAIFFRTGLDVRELSMSKGRASMTLDALMSEETTEKGYSKIVKRLQSEGATGTPKKFRPAKPKAQKSSAPKSDQSDLGVDAETLKLAIEVVKSLRS